MPEVLVALALLALGLLLVRTFAHGDHGPPDLTTAIVPAPVPARAGPPLRTGSAPRHGRTRLFGLGALDQAGGRPHAGPYAVIGYATTGFSPVGDHLVSLAILHADETGAVEGGHVMHVAPGTAAVPPHLNHLTADLHSAPPFAEVAPTLLRLLAGRVVVTHHAEFLEAFLDTHLMQVGALVPSLPTLCTFETGRALIPARNHRLSTLAAHVGAAPVVGRDALVDARATAAVLPVLLRRAGGRLSYPCDAPGDPASVVLPPPPEPRTRPSPDPWVAALLGRTSTLARELNDIRVARFVDALTSLLLEGRIVTDEVRHLIGRMVAAGYSADQLRRVQERLLENVRRAAYEEKRLDARHVHHLRAMAVSVGIRGYFDDLIPPAPVAAPTPGSGSFSRPVRRPPPPAPPAHLPRCGHCLATGHYTSACPRRERGPVRAIDPI